MISHMSNDQLTTKQANQCNRPSSLSKVLGSIGGNIRACLNGVYYRRRCEQLEAQYRTSDVIGADGYFRVGHLKYDCTVSGIVPRLTGGDLLLVDYTTKDGIEIEGAEIRRSEFHPDLSRLSNEWTR